MYIPPQFREEDSEKLLEFMQANSFATLVSVLDGVPFASHIPLVVTVDQEHDTIKLIGHLAKANPHWQAFGVGESLAIFSGAHAYVSPSLYEQQQNVPTWNYIAVHAYGTVTPIVWTAAPEAMHGMINGMIASYEPAYQAQWDTLSDTYRHGMMQGIVGFELLVARLEGKYKLSQNRSLMDQHRVAQALGQSANVQTAEIGHAMRANLPE